MNKKGCIVLVLVIALACLIVYAADSDNDGLADDQENWTAEWFDCSNTRVRLNVSADINRYDTDGDTLNDYEERIWDLNPTDRDTDGDSLDEGDAIYSFVDPCPKHCNDFCIVQSLNYWKDVACNQNPSFMYQMINDYLFKITHLSYVFNTQDTAKPNFIFGLYSEWKYDDTDTNFSDDWTNRTYDDSSWPSGDAYLGYNEFLISTNLSYGPDPQNKTITYYFRKHFNITNTSLIDNLQFNIDYDDGFAAYLNRHEITRSSGASTDHYTIVPYHESTIGDFVSSWHVYDLNSTELGYLTEGDNVIAVEIHQTKHPTGVLNSSDIVIGAYLVNYENLSASGILSNVNDMCTVLSTNTTSEDILKQELLTLWLNVVSSGICYTENILHSGSCSSIPADTIEELLGYAENIIINNITTEYSNTINYLNLINNLNCLDCSQCRFDGEWVNISVNPDYKSVDILWLPASAAADYRVYYSENLTAMRYIDPSNLNPQISYVTVNSTNWTDYQPVDQRAKFYRVAVRCANDQVNVSRILLGKQTYYLKASQDGQRQNNLIAHIHDYNDDLSAYYNYDFSYGIYLNTFCAEFPVICSTTYGWPVIQTIIRDDPEVQTWNVHPYSFAVGAGYQMNAGQGYKILVNTTYNKTEVGVVPDYIYINLTASSDGDKQNNLFGDIYIGNEDFRDRLNEICSQYPNICSTTYGWPVIQTIVRDNPEKQYWNVHPYSFAVGAGYPMYSGVGYKILVNESIYLIYNNTVIR